MTGLCVDTSAYSNFRRGESRVIEQIDRGALGMAFRASSLASCMRGFAPEPGSIRTSATSPSFLRQPVVQVLAVDEEVARIYGEIVSELRTAGRPLPTNDIWIAATAVRFGATVLTFDAHYREIGRVGSIVLGGV